MKLNLLIISAFLSAMTFSGLVQAQQTPHGGGFDRNAMSKVCQGKKSGQPVNTKMGDRTVKGTCELGFSANNPDALPRGERGQQQSTAQACNGKKVGQNVTVKMNGKAVNGKCEIRFKGQHG